jgi:hypothetical protein
MKTGRQAIRAVGTAAAALALLGVGCGGRLADDSLTLLASQSSDVTTLDFTRTISATVKPVAPLEVTVANPADAQDLYRATVSLPLATSTTTCASDGSVRYHLTFRDAGSGAILMQADEEPDGCQLVTISGVSHALVAGPAYWARLSQGLGVPESIMYPAEPGAQIQ